MKWWVICFDAMAVVFKLLVFLATVYTLPADLNELLREPVIQNISSVVFWLAVMFTSLFFCILFVNKYRQKDGDASRVKTLGVDLTDSNGAEVSDLKAEGFDTGVKANNSDRVKLERIALKRR